MSGPYFQERWNQYVHNPGCCDEARKFFAVYLSFENMNENRSWEAPKDLKPGAEWRPQWIVRCYEKVEPKDTPYYFWLHVADAKFCPFCGAAVPKVEYVNPPGPVLRVTDGGYYCDTCGERCDGCTCLPPDVCYRVKRDGD